jgi:histidinol-phosphatase (PHP family)
MTLEELASNFKSFILEATRLRHKYESQISLLVGLETDYITDLDLVNLKTLIAEHKNDIDYIVGSVHHVNKIPIDFDNATYQRAVSSCLSSDTTTSASSADSLQAFFGTYFDAQYTLLTAHHPEVIGHFDLCRLYTPSVSFEDYPAIMTKIRRNVQYAIDYGAVFELNAAALRKDWPTPYPGRDVFEVRQWIIRILRSDCSFVVDKILGRPFCNK